MYNPIGILSWLIWDSYRGNIFIVERKYSLEQFKFLYLDKNSDESFSEFNVYSFS